MASDLSLYKNCDCTDTRRLRCSHAWYFAFFWGGEYYRTSIDKYVGHHVGTKGEAGEAAERLRDDIKAGRWAKGGPVGPSIPVPAAVPLSVRSLFTSYSDDHLAVHGLRSADDERARLRRAADTVVALPDGRRVAFGDLPANGVTVGHLNALVRARLQATERKHCRCGHQTWATCPHSWHVSSAGAKTSCNRLIARVRACFAWALRNEFVEQSPFRRGGVSTIGLLKEQERYRRLDEGEDARLCEAASPHLRACIECALETGMRRGEILGLTWGQVRANMTEIHLQADDTKAGRVRIIPVSARLRAVLDMRRLDPEGVEFGSGDFVFGTVTGERIQSISTAWRATCRRAGIAGLRFHDLRRESGSRMLESGYFGLHATRDFLGHSNISVTSRYLQAQTGGLQKAMRQRDAALAQASQATVTVYVLVGVGSLAMPVRVAASAAVSGFVGTHAGHAGYRLVVASPVPEGDVPARVVCSCGASCAVLATHTDAVALVTEMAERASVVPGEAITTVSVSRVN